MAISPRLIRRRIRSVGNTRKITKAMELVAASKMRRAIAAALSSRRYARAGWGMVASLSGRAEEAAHPLLAERPARRVMVILCSSHRGLAGGFNANVIRRALERVRTPGAFPGTTAETVYSFVAVGRKGEDALRRAGLPILASFATLGDTPSFVDATPVAALARREFVAGRVDRVFLVSTDFVSAILQRPTVREILPVSARALEEAVAAAGPFAAAEAGAPTLDPQTLFEPGRATVLGAILPRMVDTQVYQGLLESSASEHSARMLAMRNATDAAGDMIDDLTFTYNQARQGAITREISEIAAGKASLEA